MAPLTINAPVDLADRLAARAAADGVSLSQAGRDAIEAWLAVRPRTAENDAAVLRGWVGRRARTPSGHEGVVRSVYTTGAGTQLHAVVVTDDGKELPCRAGNLTAVGP